MKKYLQLAALAAVITTVQAETPEEYEAELNCMVIEYYIKKLDELEAERQAQPPIVYPSKEMLDILFPPTINVRIVD
jgi:hypothetical protein